MFSFIGIMLAQNRAGIITGQYECDCLSVTKNKDKGGKMVKTWPGED